MLLAAGADVDAADKVLTILWQTQGLIENFTTNDSISCPLFELLIAI